MRRLPLVLLGLMAALALAEATVRLVQPAPRVQVMTEGRGAHLYEAEGAVLWTTSSPDVPSPRDCGPAVAGGARLMTFVGDSVFSWARASGGTPTVLFTELLQRAVEPDWCVANVSQPAFSGQQQLAALRAHLRVSTPEVVFWEVWKSDGGWQRFGDSAMNLEVFALDEAALPRPLGLSLPAAPHRWLLGQSAAWRLLVSTASARVPDSGRPEEDLTWGQRSMVEAVELLRSRGIRPVLVLVPGLDQPLADSVGRGTAGRIGTWARAQGVEVIELAAELADQDVEAIRLDTCCHYNRAGHEAVAAVLHRWLEAQRMVAGDPD